eukprot:CAMPEP_0114270556 /NCGR_PEP_ID=MMETSP0058-20121206/27315_1 /TAXON_ID=36894 /ORGANISM="Pyramimonas parkeae, CCMP726" /LENGTH=90 /DNA_ID=CAMNT_0001389329 /DNA_START=2326 /DNA_END=2598 /DNA_ORIENTATION=-
MLAARYWWPRMGDRNFELLGAHLVVFAYASSCVSRGRAWESSVDDGSLCPFGYGELDILSGRLRKRAGGCTAIGMLATFIRLWRWTWTCG